MAKAVHVGNQTEHGVPLTGSGSPNVFINGKPAWRAIPTGVGDGLEEASKAIKQIMDKPLLAPPDVAPDRACPPCARSGGHTIRGPSSH